MKDRQQKKATVQYECSCGNTDVEEFSLIPMTGYMFVTCNECGRMYRINPNGKSHIKKPIIEWKMVE